MFLIIIFAFNATSAAVDYDGHSSFNQHYANGVSSLNQYKNQQGKSTML